MPDFSYYATFDESIALLRSLVDQCGVRIIPDPGVFSEPVAPSFNSVTEQMIEQLRKKRALFLAGSFTLYDPVMHRRSSGTAIGTYYLSLDEGGPLIQMTIATVNDVQGPTLISGSVSYQKFYKDPNTGVSPPASAEVRESFKSIVSTMKKNLVAHQLSMKIWIGPAALQLLRAGMAEIVDKGVIGSP